MESPLMHPWPAPAQPERDGLSCVSAFQRDSSFIVSTLRRLGVRPADIQDLTQDVFMAMCRSWPKYDPSRPWRRYLFAIVFHTAAAHRRKHRREVLVDYLDPLDTAQTVEESFRSAQEQRLVQRALDRVPAARRSLLVMHHIDGIPVTDAARDMLIPLSTAYTWMRRGHKELRRALKRLMADGSAPLPLPRGLVATARRTTRSGRTAEPADVSPRKRRSTRTRR
jgi:RNA polymerase sigma-70 factor (ECF subfamily)